MELDRLRAAVQDLETENDALAGDLEKVKGSLEETEDEARRLQEEVGRKDDESRKSGADPAEVERLQEELEELTQASLSSSLHLSSAADLTAFLGTRRRSICSKLSLPPRRQRSGRWRTSATTFTTSGTTSPSS